MKKSSIIIIGVIAVAILGFLLYQMIGAGSRAGNGNQNAGSSSSSNFSSSQSSSVSSEAREIIVSGSNFKFSPAALSVKNGEKIKIIFKNEGGYHDFTINEFNVATKKINGGEEDAVEFIADKAGQFEYYCSIGNHRAMGMRGTLVVIEE